MIKKEQTRHDRIERYLLGKLSEAERAQFEHEIESDASLKHEVELMYHIIVANRRKGDAAVVAGLRQISSGDELEAILQRAEQKHKIRQRSHRHILAGIGVLVAATIVAIIFIGLQPQHTAEQLYERSRQMVSTDWPGHRGSHLLDAEAIEQLDRAISLYRQHDYAAALSLIDSIATGMRPDDVPDDLWFYSSVCLIEAGRNAEATERLKSLVAKPDSEYREEAQWQLMLVYLKENKRNEAKVLLQQIVTEKGFYARNAEIILEQLNKRKWL